MSDAWPNSREASKSVAFTSSTVAPAEKRRGMEGVGPKEKFTETKKRAGRKCGARRKTEMCRIPEKEKTDK